MGVALVRTRYEDEMGGVERKLVKEEGGRVSREKGRQVKGEQEI